MLWTIRFVDKKGFGNVTRNCMCLNYGYAKYIQAI